MAYQGYAVQQARRPAFYERPFPATDDSRNGVYFAALSLFGKQEGDGSPERGKKGIAMTKKQKKLVVFITALCGMFAIVPAANAMHIMEGFLPITFCVLWGVFCVPFLVVGFMNIRKRLDENRQMMMLLALTGAFVFVISSLKIPSVTGSCSHMTGTGLGAILFGPCVTSILGIIVLIFQAILLAHGGVTSLGANCFSMAIAGPLLSFGLYKLLAKSGMNRKVNVFIAAFAGDLFTYCVTSFQLALAHPSPTGGFGYALVKYLGVFAPTQVPLAVIEGILTVVIVIGLETYAKDELKGIGFLKGAQNG